MTMGVFGGNSTGGAHNNEDGALCWSDAHHQWELAAVLDGHNGADSVRLLLDVLDSDQRTFVAILSEAVGSAIPRLHRRMLDVLSSTDTALVDGETACLIVARKGHYLWWLSVGDCALYVLHPEYARFGQYAVNQRSFFEWVGEVNTFREAVPCYTTGTKRLRGGRNIILAVTDGVLECGSRPLDAPQRLYDAACYSPDSGSCGVREILHRVQLEGGTDSATVVAWDHVCEDPGPYPSNWEG